VIVKGSGGAGISRQDLNSDSADEEVERRGAAIAIKFEDGENAEALHKSILYQYR